MAKPNSQLVARWEMELWGLGLSCRHEPLLNFSASIFFLVVNILGKVSMTKSRKLPLYHIWQAELKCGPQGSHSRLLIPYIVPSAWCGQNLCLWWDSSLVSFGATSHMWLLNIEMWLMHLKNWMCFCLFVCFCHHIFGSILPFTTSLPPSLWEPPHCCLCLWVSVISHIWVKLYVS